MKKHSLKPGWKMVKFGEVVKNANLVERNPEALKESSGSNTLIPRICIFVAGISLRMAPHLPANSCRGRRFSASAVPINAKLPMPSLKASAPEIS